jgi:hypothetical protein
MWPHPTLGGYDLDKLEYALCQMLTRKFELFRSSCSYEDYSSIR